MFNDNVHVWRPVNIVAFHMLNQYIHTLSTHTLYNDLVGKQRVLTFNLLTGQQLKELRLNTEMVRLKVLQLLSLIMRLVT